MENKARSGIMGKIKSAGSIPRIKVKILGEEVEFKAPSMGVRDEVLDKNLPECEKSWRYLITCCVLPGTDILVFEETDYDTLTEEYIMGSAEEEVIEEKDKKKEKYTGSVLNIASKVFADYLKVDTTKLGESLKKH